MFCTECGTQATDVAKFCGTCGTQLARTFATSDVAESSPVSPAEAQEPAGEYELLGKGPAGGIVFYDAKKRQPWGRYLECAPKGWSGSESDDIGLDFAPQFGGSGTAIFNAVQATSQDIGSGAANSRRIIEAIDSPATSACLEYRGGGFDDWFLPSKGELEELYKYFIMVESIIYRAKGISRIYWSSTVLMDESGDAGIASVTIPSIIQNTLEYCIRPVRAFS